MSFYIYTTINYPGASNTVTYGINDSGQIVGGHYDSQGNFSAFLDSNGSYSTLTNPSASESIAYGISDSGQIVGYYYGTQGGAQHGFVDNNGSYTTVDDPDAAGTGTVATGTNGGLIVGYRYSFLYNNTTGF